VTSKKDKIIEMKLNLVGYLVSKRSDKTLVFLSVFFFN